MVVGNPAPALVGQTVDRLLAAAADVFTSRGFVEASIIDIAAAAGLTPGAIYANFRSKADLFAAVADRRGQQEDSNRLEIAESRADLASTLVALSDWNVARRHDARDAFLLSGEFFLLHLARDQRRVAPMRRLFADRCRREAAFLGRLVAQHGLQPALDVDELAVVSCALSDGLDVVSWYDAVPPELDSAVTGVLLGVEPAGIPYEAFAPAGLVPVAVTAAPSRRRLQHKTLTRTIPALLAAGEQLFLARGYQAVTVEDIAAAAGFSKTAVYANFGGKEQLFLAVVVNGRHIASQRLAASLDPCSDLGELLSAIGATSLRSRRRHFDLFLHNAEFWITAMRRPELAAEVAGRLRDASASVEGAIRRAVSAEELDPTMASERLALALVALDQGLDAYATFAPTLVSPSLLRRTAAALLGRPSPTRTKGT